MFHPLRPGIPPVATNGAEGYPPGISTGGLNMKGSVRTMEKCAVCKESYQRIKHPLTKDVIDLMCPDHLTRPSRVYIDGRHIKDRHGAVGYKFTDNDGRPYEYFGAAHRDLEAIRKEIDGSVYKDFHRSRVMVGDEQTANARLIAAAPELLEACVAAANMLIATTPGCTAVQMCLDAIAKATGSPPG